MLIPRANAELFGQEEAESAFQRRWEAGKVPHAWLITGPKGCGKATLAYRLARFVLKEGDVSSGLGGGLGLFDDAPAVSSLKLSAEDPVFRRVEQGSHTDLLVLEPEEGKVHISVESARKVGQFLSLTPAESSWRVVIVDSVDDMNPAAANAVLKILEEPPAQALIFLVSHVPGRLLPTIRSRCQALRLHPLAAEACDRVLEHVHPEKISPKDRELARLLTNGSPGRMLALLDGDGLKPVRSLFGVLEGMPSPDLAKMLNYTASLADKEKHQLWRQVMEAYLWWLERATRNLGAGRAPEPELFAGETALQQAMGEAQPLDSWVEMWEKARGWLREAEILHLDRRQVLNSVLFALRDALADGNAKRKVAL